MPLSLSRSAALLCAAATLLPSARAISPAFNYGAEKVRGVNLGGWLVLEPWITSSLFDATGNDAIIDEFTFGKLQDKGKAKAALQKHWDTWITEGDFDEIKGAGLNHVRIPIGYWAFDVSEGEPYIQGQVPYLQRAVGWASARGIKVIVDLHGAPGSQNGFDNSGQKMDFPQWHTSQDNVDRTNNVLKTISKMFVNQADTVTVIAPLNEPAGFYGDAVLNVVKQYWKDSYGNIRFPPNHMGQSNIVELIHDAFQPLSYWQGFETSGFDGVAMDTHIYQMFSDDEVARSDDDHIKAACASQGSLSSFDLWVIVGEWTPAATDCAKYLNGRGIGARYDGSFPGSSKHGSCKGKTGAGSSFSSAYKTFLRKYWEAQAMSFERGAGWVQWTWKAEGADEWAYQAGLRNGWIPQDPTDYKFPDICG